VKELDDQGIVLRFSTRAEVFCVLQNFHIRPRNGRIAAKKKKKENQPDSGRFLDRAVG